MKTTEVSYQGPRGELLQSRPSAGEGFHVTPTSDSYRMLFWDHQL
ncbi:hypothetical protein THTE_1621 [Thermogutta terrifontis]|uniref:Uncharacterized protein n=1 Tax=Thermogutta terrifontis TaxID=1331910 RepID=A0A286RE59_9BACT|nr:hypothetical protein THTE_1621 [Thermogutta terrifontis]